MRLDSDDDVTATDCTAMPTRLASLAECHPDYIDGPGEATEQAYKENLIYLKSKVACSLLS
jgi:hypothetical protein